MENEFAKIFTVKNHQVVVTKDEKEDGTPQIVIVFHEIAVRDKAFEKYTSDGALVALRQMENFILKNNGNK